MSSFPPPVPGSGTVSPWADGLSDVSIAGDPLAWPHLAPAPLPHPVSVGDFAALARRVAADRDRWRPLVRYDALTRWYARLETGAGYEVWLLSWLPGQGSGRHDHGRSSGVLTVLEGELTERSLTGAGQSERLLAEGAQRVFAPGYLHEMVNTSLEPAVSLHVYFPGLTEMTPYGSGWGRQQQAQPQAPTQAQPHAQQAVAEALPEH
ncbi:cysteine dioxygenase family protein [Streptacidiphilus sp. N1-10]|uniref:Cysteine dioxygenase family protein n=1 Tax=Streptacidiphilus jeojiensis TaxID=3229225 RepID=A0ABV6XJG2_9ACTN